MGTSQPVISAIATIGIPVSDQDRALEFYTETLGLQKQLDVPLPRLGGRWVTIAPPGAATTIALLRAHDGVPVGLETEWSAMGAPGSSMARCVTAGCRA